MASSMESARSSSIEDSEFYDAPDQTHSNTSSLNKMSTVLPINGKSSAAAAAADVKTKEWAASSSQMSSSRTDTGLHLNVDQLPPPMSIPPITVKSLRSAAPSLMSPGSAKPPSSPMMGVREDSAAQYRRNKLLRLRQDINVQFDGDATTTGGGEAATLKSPLDQTGCSERSSLSSWGMQFLQKNTTDADRHVVHAADTCSTFAQLPPSTSKILPPNQPWIPPPPSGGHGPIRMLSPELNRPATTRDSPTSINNESNSNSSSEASSKSATLSSQNETSEPDSLTLVVSTINAANVGERGNKSSSLDRTWNAAGVNHRQLTMDRFYSTSSDQRKSASLSRDLSLGSSELMMYSFDNQCQDSKAQSQHAVDLIDQITRSALPATVQHAQGPILQSPPDKAADDGTTPTKIEPKHADVYGTRPTGSFGSETAPQATTATVHQQPDIIISNTKPSNLQLQQRAVCKPLGAPPAPPTTTHIDNADSTLNCSTLPDLRQSTSAQQDPITEQVNRRMSLTAKKSFAAGKYSFDRRQSECSSVVSFGDRQSSVSSRASWQSGMPNGCKQNRNWFGRVMHRAVVKARHAADGVSRQLHVAGTSKAGSDDEVEDEDLLSSEQTSIVRAKHAKKGPRDFEQLRHTQTLNNEHTGAIWCIKFSLCGRLLATGGQDNVVRVWVLKDHYEYFGAMRDKYNMETSKSGAGTGNLSDALMSLNVLSMRPDQSELDAAETASRSTSSEETWSPFAPKPFVCYRAHTSDVLDVSWSKSYFMLSSSMDRTVRLWHISRTECLCVFQHVDFVTSIAFLPKDDRYFLSGSLDGKLRLWHIPDKKVALWNEIEHGLITALALAKNGKFVVVGTFEGKCVFFTTEQLKYFTVIDVRSHKGKKSKGGQKITGLAVTGVNGDKLLVTSNDSRIRLYDLRDLSLTCKYKGASNQRSQIKANFSPSGRHICCGSEDHFIYLWRTSLDSVTFSVRKDRNGVWERVRAHSAVVTGACFAPKPELIFEQAERAKQRSALDRMDLSAVGRSNTLLETPNTSANNNNKGTSKSVAGMNNNSNSNSMSAGTSASVLRRRQSIMSSQTAATGTNTPQGVLPNSGRTYSGDVLVSSDFQGTIHVFVQKTRMQTGASVFFAGD